MGCKRKCKQGPIAQLGARLNGIEKVESSNLSGSTISSLRAAFSFSPPPFVGGEFQPKAGSVSEANGGEGNVRKSGIEKVSSFQEALHPLQEVSHSSNLSGSTRSSLRAAFFKPSPWRRGTAKRWMRYTVEKVESPWRNSHQSGSL